MTQTGKVIRIIGGFYDLKVGQKIVRLRGSGKMRQKNFEQIVVGDFVAFRNNIIYQVLPRKNFFSRPKIANVDQIFLVCSYVEPEFSSFFLDKLLFFIEYQAVKPIIIFTKKDKTHLSKKNEYLNLGYQVFEIGFDNYFKNVEIFASKTSILVGQSGVGKTTLLNFLTNQKFAVGEISKSLKRGKHTTRETQIVDCFGGELVDSPGFSDLKIAIPKENLGRAFKIFADFFSCKFRNCLHFQEKTENCNIKKLVKLNKIPLWRYQNYLKIIKEIIFKK